MKPARKHLPGTSRDTLGTHFHLFTRTATFAGGRFRCYRRYFQERETGLEPATFCLEGLCTAFCHLTVPRNRWQ